MATSGVIVVALNKAAERELKRQFREREPKKLISPAFGGIWATKGWWICRADLRLAEPAAAEGVF